MAAASVGITLYSLYQQNELADEQQEAAENEAAATKRKAEILAARKRRESIRAARIATAQTTAAGVASGSGSQSSAIQGALGSIGTQLASGIGTLGQIEQLTIQESIFQQQQVDIAAESNRIGGYTSALSSIFTAAGQHFGSPPSTPSGGGRERSDIFAFDWNA